MCAKLCIELLVNCRVCCGASCAYSLAQNEGLHLTCFISALGGVCRVHAASSEVLRAAEALPRDHDGMVIVNAASLVAVVHHGINSRNCYILRACCLILSCALVC